MVPVDPCRDGPTGDCGVSRDALATAVVIVSVAVAALPLGVTEFGERVQVVCAGKLEQVSDVAVLNPLEGVMETVLVSVPPAPEMVPEEGLRLSVKEGVAEVVTVIVAAAETEAAKEVSPP